MEVGLRLRGGVSALQRRLDINSRFVATQRRGL